MPEHPVPHPDVAGHVLGVLEPGEARDFTHHLKDCADCRQEVAELSSVRAALDQALPAPEVPPGLAERTLAAVERAAAGATPGSADPDPALVPLASP
ncbi:MAG: zf-HC2 domain-containing protein, partial [Acidimicrobiales bacterium]